MSIIFVLIIIIMKDSSCLRLISWVKSQSLTQAEIADSIGLTRSGLTAILSKGKKISKTIALALECAYGVRSDWILEGKGEPMRQIWTDYLKLRDRMILDLKPESAELEMRWWEKKLEVPRKKKFVATLIIEEMRKNSAEGVEILQSRFNNNADRMAALENSLLMNRSIAFRTSQQNGSNVTRDEFQYVLLLVLWSGKSPDEVSEKDDRTSLLIKDKGAFDALKTTVREIEADLSEMEKLYAPEIFAKPYLDYQINRVPFPINRKEILYKISPAQIDKFWMELGSAEDLFELVYTCAA